MLLLNKGMLSHEPKGEKSKTASRPPFGQQNQTDTHLFPSPQQIRHLYRHRTQCPGVLALKLSWGLAFNIAGVESMLLWNDVVGVHAIVGSLGQVMALLIVVFTTVQFGMAASKVSERGCQAVLPSDALCLPYATGSAEKGLLRAAAIGRGGGGQPTPP
ncbi:hypothetical protein B0H14DRAFT_3457407 [Mycena olivaceomarginata]|nr:hypothetical protein B0H14DRAFT_3457407 [Mycena olivaceomarginata]